MRRRLRIVRRPVTASSRRLMRTASLEGIAQVRSTRGTCLVQAADGGGDGGRLQLLGRAFGAFRDLVHHLDEAVERLEALRLGRLDHERLFDDEREIDGGWM